MVVSRSLYSIITTAGRRRRSCGCRALLLGARAECKVFPCHLPYLFAPAPDLATLSPHAIHARLRAVWPQGGEEGAPALAQPQRAPLTGAHFAFLWNTPACWEAHLPRNASARLELYDDQLSLVPRALVGLVAAAGLPAALQAADARGCWPHPFLAAPPFTTPGDWGEAHFTRAVLCGGGALAPLAWEARLQKFAGYGACFDKPCAGEVKQCSSVA